MKLVHGIEIKKLKIGEWLNTLPLINDFAEKFTDILSLKNGTMLDFLNMTTEDLTNILKKVITECPKDFTNLLIYILGCKKEDILDNDGIGIYELIEIVKAIIEVNRVGESVGLILKPMLAKYTKTEA